MTLDENLNLLNNTKKRIKASLDNKVPQSTDNKPFGKYYTVVDGIEQFSTNIDDYTVADCVKFADITDTSILSVNQYTKSVNIPTTVTSLGKYCFSGCTSLSAITIPESVTSLGGWCFKNCTSLSAVIIHDGVTSLGPSCFYGCSSLTGITIPYYVTSICGHCFSYCSSLSSVTIHDAVTSLGDYCFSDCSSLTSVIIPDAVTSLGNSCFQFCSCLTSVTCKATTPPTLGSKVFDGTSSTFVIYVPAESVDAYKTATNWSEYANKIQAITS